MQVYVVLEDDRGCGPSVDAVFSSLEAAHAYIERKGNSHLFVANEHRAEVVDEYVVDKL